MPPQRRKNTLGLTEEKASSSLVDETQITPAVSPFYEDEYVSRRSTSPVATVAEIPEVYAQPDATGALNDKERTDLAACESALDTLRVAFWRAGKALRVINAARLYRETHPTFDDYVADRWQMQRAYAYRLMDAVPIAEPISLSPMGDKLNERQVRELGPVAADHGAQAAAELYLTLAKELEGGPRITADLVRKAATAITSALPAGSAWDSETVADIVHTALFGPQPQGQQDDEAPAWFESEGHRVAALADKVAKRARKHPAEARAFVAALEEHGRRIREALGE